MKHKNKTLFVIGALLIVIVMSVSFAYYVMNIIFEGDGSSVSATTKQIGDVTITYEGNIDLGTEETETDVLPGHKSISEIRVTAESTGDEKEILYDLFFEGYSYYNLNYTLYKTTEELDVSVSCKEVEEILIGEIRYSEQCTINNESLLGESVTTGEISNTILEEKGYTNLKSLESILATAEGTTVYYYIVLELPNENYEQEYIDEFGGRIAISQPERLTVDDIISYSIWGVRTPNFANTSCSRGDSDIINWCDEETVGLYCWDVDTNGKCTGTSTNKTYFYRGDVNDNYVEFAGFYWRIIRINENGSLRLIYSGNKEEVDQNNKNIILENGYNDADADYTQIGFGIFGDTGEGPVDVGYMYTEGQMKGNNESSHIKEMIDKWYEDNLTEYTKYMDSESGFCGDRESELNDYGHYIYGPDIRLSKNNPEPIFGCPDSNNDLYTVNKSSIGNKALTYPIGLITADETAFAGAAVHGYFTGNGRAENTRFYLYTGTPYITISPCSSSAFDVGDWWREIITLDGDGVISADAGGGVRPVININVENLKIYGSGTIGAPYIIMP